MTGLTRNSGDGDRRPDPLRMGDQPALRTSEGRIWLVMGGLFAAVVIAAFSPLALDEERSSSGVALGAACVIAALYAAMIVVRFAVSRRVVRLRAMAACMLAMAAVGLVGMLLCLFVERTPT